MEIKEARRAGSYFGAAVVYWAALAGPQARRWPPGAPRVVKVLIVEDQQRLAQLLKQGLTERSYTVAWARSCAAARDALCETSYDLIILDLGLPDGDGLDLLREWRKNGFKEPVLILSARDAVQDRVKGLDLGADDYLSKPFSLEELLARVRSQLRRQSDVKETVLEHGVLRLDLVKQAARLNGQPVDLTRREFALLEIFMQNPGRILTRTLISEKIWASHFDVDTNLLDVYMSRLRAKLEKPADKPLFKTVRGVGYQLL
ncbi:MAG: DNA-binding response regulator in two-component regulatory system with QseC [Gammaproteobacteria bacterium]|jgi:DNA-binding response OmpR family regulator|nr:DNA-binding response regulator in two-component regulatory system with QseC [Gammaproteobacteria bacterium]